MNTPIINFEALKKSHWSAQANENVALVADFIQNLMNNHDFDYVLKKYDNNVYVQHNRNIPDGVKALVTYVKNFVKRFPAYSYDVKHIYVDGNYVTFHSHVTVNKKHRGNPNKGLNIIDTWEIVDGKISHHWDAIQPIDAMMRFIIWLTGGKVRNSNGLF